MPFAGRSWLTHRGVAKHAYCVFDFNPAWGLSEINITLCVAKAERSIVTTMSQRTIMKVLGLFIHSAKQDVLLKAEMKRLVLLAIAKGGTCVTIIEDDYNRSQGAHVP